MVALVGRQPELARLREHLRAGADAPSALVIEGEPGIGKTALFEAALATASGTVLKARCAEAESSLAFACLADLLGPWLDTVEPLATPLQRALDIALLRDDARPGDAVEPHHVARAVLEVLKALAPAVVAIDDVHWLDPASAAALSFAYRRLDTVRFLFTQRPGPHPFAGAVERLDPLTTGEIETLLADRRLPRRRLAEVVEIAAGNPLYARELAAAPGQTSLPPRLEHLIAARIAALPAKPLAVVASLAAPTMALVKLAVGSRAKHGIDCALDAGVLHIDEGRLRFTHPLLGVAALGRLSRSTRRNLHGRLATVITDPQERAWHLAEAADGPDAQVAAEVERGADLARARAAPHLAGELAERAIRLTPPQAIGDLIRRRIAAGYHWVIAGEAGRGRSHLSAALDSTPPGPMRRELQWRLGMVCHLDGDTNEAVRLLEAALAETGDDPVLRATIGRKLAGLYGWQGRMAEAYRLADEAVRWAERTGDSRLLIECLANKVNSLLFQGRPAPTELLERIERLLPDTGPFAAHEDPEALLAMAAFAAGDLDGAAAGLDRVQRRAEEQGDDLGAAWLAGYRASVELVAGRWQLAHELATEALVKARAVNISLALWSALYSSALVDAHLGDADRARTMATELVAMGERQSIVPVEAWGREVLGFVALSVGDAAEAHAQFGPLRARLDEIGIQDPMLAYQRWGDLDALVELGRFAEAEAVAADLQRRGEAANRVYVLAVAARCRGLVLAARDDFAGARAEFERALAEHDRSRWAFERARTLLAFGSVLRRAKQKRASREALQEARAVFDGLGARLWSAKAAAELARIGGRTASIGELTPTERRVAEAVVEGGSNQEVADRLFLSRKTVAAHLTKVYRKLGVRSRVELARRLGKTAN